MKKALLIAGIVLDIVISLILLFVCTPAQNQPLAETQNTTQIQTTATEDKKFTFKVDKIIVGNRAENPTITPCEPSLVG